MTLKEFIDHLQQDLNDPVFTPIAIEKTIRIIKEDHNTEINLTIRMTRILETITLSDSIGSLENYHLVT